MVNLTLGSTLKRTIALAQKEITLMLGASTGENINASLVHAERLIHEKNAGNILYINTVQTPWKLSESVRKALPDAEDRFNGINYFDESGTPKVFFLNSEMGELHREKEEIYRLCRSEKIQTIIINSWDCAAKNTSTRETLLYLLRGFNRGDKNPQIDYQKVWAGVHNSWAIYDYFPATILIYAEEKDQKYLDLGKISRGGFGKLMAMADQLVHIPAEQQLYSGQPEVVYADTESSATQSQKEIPVEKRRIRDAEELHLVPVFVPPVTNVPRTPIHMNGYSPDREPVQSLSREISNIDVITK